MASIEIKDLGELEKTLHRCVRRKASVSFSRSSMLPNDRTLVINIEMERSGSYNNRIAVVSEDKPDDFSDFKTRVRQNLEVYKGRKESIDWQLYDMNCNSISIIKPGENVISYGLGLAEKVGEKQRQLVFCCGTNGQLPRRITPHSKDFVDTMAEMAELSSYFFHDYLLIPDGPADIRFYI
jgi:hypothetical protein